MIEPRARDPHGLAAATAAGSAGGGSGGGGGERLASDGSGMNSSRIAHTQHECELNESLSPRMLLTWCDAFGSPPSGELLPHESCSQAQGIGKCDQNQKPYLFLEDESRGSGSGWLPQRGPRGWAPVHVPEAREYTAQSPPTPVTAAWWLGLTPVSSAAAA